MRRPCRDSQYKRWVREWHLTVSCPVAPGRQQYDTFVVVEFRPLFSRGVACAGVEVTCCIHSRRKKSANPSSPSAGCRPAEWLWENIPVLLLLLLHEEYRHVFPPHPRKTFHDCDTSAAPPPSPVCHVYTCRMREAIHQKKRPLLHRCPVMATVTATRSSWNTCLKGERQRLPCDTDLVALAYERHRGRASLPSHRPASASPQFLAAHAAAPALFHPWKGGAKASSPTSQTPSCHSCTPLRAVSPFLRHPPLANRQSDVASSPAGSADPSHMPQCTAVRVLCSPCCRHHSIWRQW
ncbi:hypothetical protein ECC02_004866 [Trypanosoma cruzi]|uniref:Uncharacterized protein n=1 Tax=Trypanosoma cruzi TaxID=5693 RepID=A0A7J6Y644_TRYCR|nr:hypothetical protein ECC02_004866 [Trypanosoma cruzi]